MKNNFLGFYNPTEAELSVLWSEGVFVLDSSVLLRLYEVPERTQRETFAALQKLGDRLWVPHQAALEYQRNRARTIGIAKNRVAEALDPMQAALRTFVQSANSIKLADRGHKDADDRLKAMEAAGEEVIEAARTAIASHVDINGEDPVRDQLNALLENRVGAPPKQEELTRWNEEAEKRYSHRMGPGHLDQGKSKNPTYMMDGLIFDKRFADLYVWKETIAHASDENVHSLVMITNDSKPDWWKTTENGVVGPLPELCSEIRSEAKLTNFWMYDLVSFLREAGERLNVSVSGTTLSDVSENLAKDDAIPIEAINWSKFHSHQLDDFRSGKIYKTLSKYSRKMLSDVLSARGYAVLNSSGDAAVGFKTTDGSALAVAMLAHGNESSIDEVVSEIAPVLTVGSTRKLELYLIASSTLAALDSYRVADGVKSALKKYGVSGVAFEVYSGSSNVMTLVMESNI
ncbi:PIN-like domain-containing protein [Stenotrophomonas geniculata]|uniref:PIN-like domain-containing protein n=1 Tax=Stenotrophomonas geniculata TaxID=86188 RepID=UPI0030CC2C96